MKEGVASALIGGGSSIAGGFLNAYFSKKAEERAYKRQIETEQRQLKYQIDAEKRAIGYQRDLMDYENEYNSPKNQMKRLAEAGLNPYLAGDVSAGSASDGSGAIGASGVAAESSPTYVPDMSAAAAGVASAASDFAARNLESKRLQLESLRVDAQTAQIYASMDMETLRFNYQKQRDIIRDEYDAKILNIKSQELSLEEQKLQFQKAADERDYRLREADQEFKHGIELNRDKYASDANKRAWQIHGVTVQSQSLKNALMRIDFAFMNDKDVKAAKKEIYLIERDIAKMDKDSKQAYFDRLDKTMELYDLAQNNQITEQQFLKNMRENWGTGVPAQILHSLGLYSLPSLNDSNGTSNTLGILQTLGKFAKFFLK